MLGRSERPSGRDRELSLMLAPVDPAVAEGDGADAAGDVDHVPCVVSLVHWTWPHARQGKLVELRDGHAVWPMGAARSLAAAHVIHPAVGEAVRKARGAERIFWGSDHLPTGVASMTGARLRQICKQDAYGPAQLSN
eukprot:14171869-Alexandrium_andersonii.AAC.1